MLELPSPTAVVCHDAGAANIIMAWMPADAAGIRAMMQGPAARLWANRFGSTALCNSVDEALEGAAALLSGTGWASDLEHQARIQARALGIASHAVIDHWVNYEQRFVRDGQTVWPDEFWVTDDYALAEARKRFPGQKVRLQRNLYMEQQLKAIPAASPAHGRTEVLYVLEPIRHWGGETPGELQALDYFVDHLETAGLPDDSVIVLRPHPSDPPHKYDHWIADHPHQRIEMDSSGDLATAIGRRRWVAGAESNALVLALLAGRDVICTLPPWAPACRLPHAGLIHLKELVDAQ